MEQTEQETIIVRHQIENDAEIDWKVFEFTSEKYTIHITIAGEKDHYPGVRIGLQHIDSEEILYLEITQKNGMFGISISDEAGGDCTDEKTVSEWVEIERVNKAIKIIGEALK